MLKKIEINGFKSFAQKSVLNFCAEDNKKANITAIVGPNGSGKSNVADAIRWVLGEQSYKLLRSKKSEDVIFAGSAKRQRGSFAEVTLFLDNSSKKMPIDFTEVVLSRRLYRDGTNEYRLNGSKVRLIDILEFLAKCGFGQATYTVIGQGMVDQMLFYGAKERKILFDEAAGVKQYEIKREQAVRKLEATDQNLIRIKDILGELSPRLKHLKKQIERAEEKKNLEAELKETLKSYYSHRWMFFSSKISEKNKTKEEFEKEKEKVENELRELEKKVLIYERKGFQDFEKLRHDFQMVSDERDKLKEKFITIVGNLRVEKERKNLTDDKRFLEEKLKKEEYILNIEAQIETKEKELIQRQNELAKLVKEMSEIQAKFLEAQSRLKESEGSGKENLLELKKEYSELLNAQKELIKILENSRSLADIKRALKKALSISELIEVFWMKIKNLNKKGDRGEILSKIEEITKEKEKLFHKISDIKTEIGFVDSTITNLKSQKKQLSLEIENIAKNLEEAQRVSSSGSQIDSLEKELKVVQKELALKEKELEKIKDRIGEVEKINKKQEAEVLKFRSEIREKQRLLDNYNLSLREIEIEIAKVETRRDDLREEIERELEGFNFENKDLISIDLEKTEEKILRLRQKLAIIGGIDEEVEEEYRETEERYRSIESQFIDLEKAKNDTKKIIKELDEKIKSQFSEAFNKISKEFKRYFTILFGGGEASLLINKIDEGFDLDPMIADKKNKEPELGIEIIACPPGKRIKNLNMLSGGERTLTSLALLFAILSVNPSPFCVLDEVDAALDETNTKRFLEILGELSKKTQFIVITHNKDTMKKADILYGVTMDVEHISRLLSLKLKEAEKVIA